MTVANLDEELKVKKVKYSASIPIGHGMKKVRGFFELAYPVSVETAKETIQFHVKSKYNTTIPFWKVEIESFEILE